mmetsp:Transcript_9697/g.11997  ORF Transcript_9697/g.11997 Transcript_9697/m.11997 type:complete len:284 (-) Transcript_9697:126-977(-)
MIIEETTKKLVQQASKATISYKKPQGKLNVQDIHFRRELQQGGSGSIYLAELKQKRKPVAVKIVPLHTFEATERFAFECLVSDKLVHSTHVVRTQGYFIHEKSGFIVMDAMYGDLLDSMHRYTTNQSIKKLFRRVCKGVAACHRHKVAHLDIKPENILLDTKGKAYLCDFGAAHYFNGTLSSMCGTMLYNAPETKRSFSFDKAAADIWSLGVLLFILFAGVYPYPGETDTEVMDSLEKEILDFSDLDDSSCSPEAKDLVLKLLNINPNKRPSIHQVLKHPFFA